MSLQSPKSFFGGTFFGGEFFEQKAYGTVPLRRDPPAHLRARGPTIRDLRRSRGRFQVEITAEQLIVLVAARHIDDDDDEPMLVDLVREFEMRFMEWDRAYIADARRERARQIEARERQMAAEAQAQSEWLRRRQRKVRSMH